MSYSSEVLADSPLLYPRLGDASGTTCVDSSGNGRNGTYIGTLSLAQTGLLVGDADTSVDFPGTNSRVEFTDAAWMDVSTATIEALIRPDTLSGTDTIISRDLSGTAGSRCWLFRLNAGKLEFIFWDSGGTQRGPYTAATTLSTGTTYYVAVTFDGTNVNLFYGNVSTPGSLVNDGTAAITATMRNVATDINIGTRRSNSTTNADLFDGRLDEVAFYGSALSSGRLAAHYAAAINATVIAGGQATSASTAQAGSVVTGQTILGGLASVAATAAAGVVLVGTIVAGGQATSTSTAQAGVTSQGQIISGGQASETDAAQAGSVMAGALLAGGTVTETDAALAGSVALRVTGGTASEVDTAQAGTVTYTVVGGQAVQTNTALPGSLGGLGLIEGGTAEQTNEALPGAIVLGYSETDSSNADDGVVIGDGFAEVVWDPGVTPIPAHLAVAEYRTVAKVIDVAPVNGAPAVVREGSIPGAQDRVLIRDLDFTYWNDAPVQVGNYKLIDPLLYGSADLTLPGIDATFGDPVLGDQQAMRNFFEYAPVRIQRVGDGAVSATDYKGFVSRIDFDGNTVSLTIGGQAAGALSQIQVMPAVYKRRQDVENILVDLLRDARVQAHEHEGSSGVGLLKRGGTDGLSIFNETLAVWAGSDGQSITFTPNEDGEYRKTQKPGDDDPVDATAYPSDLVGISLSQDFAEQYNRVYAHGYTANGQLVTNIKTPGLTQGQAPPFSSDIGPEDSGTLVVTVQQQLALHNFFDVEDADEDQSFNDATTTAVMVLQAVGGLPVTGVVDEDTWDYLWDLAAVGYTLDDAREYPMRQYKKTQKWLRTANGSKVRENPDYDPQFKPNDLFIDVGGPFSRNRIESFAGSKLAPEGGVWSGTITFRSGLVRGDHIPVDPDGDDPPTPFDEGDVMDRRDLLPNMRIRLPYFARGLVDGGLIVYIAGIDHGPDQSQALVSSVPQTTMEVWQALERRREAKSNPGRVWSGHTRVSQIRNDVDRQWDTSSGLLAHSVKLPNRGWNEVMIPAGQSGIVQRIRMLVGGKEFACFLTQRPMGGLPQPDLDATSSFANPLTDFRPAQRPWWETHKDELDAAGCLGAWGTPRQPCGYDPGLKEDDKGPTDLPITGLFVEEAGFNYETAEYPVLYLYIWVNGTAFLQPGRILRNQRTTDF
jgi:hypothetical protein